MKFKLTSGKLFSLIILVIFAVNLCLSFSFRLKNQNYNQLLSGYDATGYYEYLPWVFKHKNINYPSGYSYEQNTGRVLKYSYGTALCQTPFYLLAQLFSHDSSSKQGLSLADAFFICFGASLYVALSLGLLFKLFEKISINGFTSIVVILLLYLGTNLFNYSVMEPFMSHVYSFFAITGFIYSIVSFNENPQNKYFAYVLLFLFLVIAIRPFNAIVVLPLILFQLYKIKNWKLGLLYFGIIISAYFIQLLCWYLQCGEWIFSSYRGEGFNWIEPQLANVLFSFRKGLFVYSPVLILGLIGLFFLKQSRSFKISLLTTLGLFTYAVSCWWHWPFGDSFGHRAFIDVYAIFGIGIVGFFETFRHRLVKIIFLIIGSICIFLNLVQTWQYHHGILPAEYMNYEKYKYQFLYVDQASQNNIGGINDIIPPSKQYEIHEDSLSFINMSGLEYSQPFEVKALKTNIGSYLTIDFDKTELMENASAKSKLYFQINDSAGKGYYFYSILLNEIPLDYELINTKKFSYQTRMPSIKPNEEMIFMIYNPEKRTFILNNIKIKYYFIVD